MSALLYRPCRSPEELREELRRAARWGRGRLVYEGEGERALLELSRLGPGLAGTVVYEGPGGTVVARIGGESVVVESVRGSVSVLKPFLSFVERVLLRSLPFRSGRCAYVTVPGKVVRLGA